MVMWVVAMNGFVISVVDIKEAYLRSAQIARYICVGSPKEWNGNLGTLWQIKNIPYVILEAGSIRKKSSRHGWLR